MKAKWPLCAAKRGWVNRIPAKLFWTETESKTEGTRPGAGRNNWDGNAEAPARRLARNIPPARASSGKPDPLAKGKRSYRLTIDIELRWPQLLDVRFWCANAHFCPRNTTFYRLIIVAPTVSSLSSTLGEAGSKPRSTPNWQPLTSLSSMQWQRSRESALQSKILCDGPSEDRDFGIFQHSRG